eukprot:1364035-Amphidinium_carterae.1
MAHFSIERLKAFMDVSSKDAKAYARWGASTFAKQQFRVTSNSILPGAEPIWDVKENVADILAETRSRPESFLTSQGWTKRQQLQSVTSVMYAMPTYCRIAHKFLQQYYTFQLNKRHAKMKGSAESGAFPDPL